MIATWVWRGSSQTNLTCLENETKGAGSAPSEPVAVTSGASGLIQAHKDAAGNVGSGSGRRPYRCSQCRQPKPCGCKRVGGQASNPQIVAAPAVSLFTEENTGRLVSLPFTLAAVATDYDDWRLDDKEQKELAVTGSVALNEWVRVDPKWVALSLFALSMVGMATAKAIGYQGEMRARQIRKMQEAAAKGKAGGNIPAGNAPPKPDPDDGAAFAVPKPGAIQ